ncbi:Arc family DNA-binding protein [Pseudomonas sp. WS 5010]|uniref:Arc family DNA-binding protein n=1 Tax=Pseudomonas sp. WS 5010 TaxID=2717489 RepID=UPI001476186D|nr:Arc family DNA-binding protein [Pseudomonas sp. WS 5010]NMX87150.1 Arc family DNA-binding protein [Pseudomonas sp. WS 5010]
MANSHEKDKFVIRLPDGLRPSINAQAKANHRSMNNEIIHRLERSLELEVLYDNQVKLNAILARCVQQLQTTVLTVEPFSIILPNKGEG